MTSPFFSIIIPSYNRASFLVDTIDSVLQQSFKSFEILLVDDGSTDNTSCLIEEAFGELNSLRYIWQPNRERAAARNNGIQQSRGKWLLFLDSDDLLQLDHLKVIKDYIDCFPACTMLTTYQSMLTNVGIKKLDSFLFTPGPISFVHLLRGNPFACNICIKNTAHIHLFPEDRALSSMEDWIFLLLNCKSTNFHLVPSDTLLMKDHPGRSMNNNSSVIRARLLATSFILNSINLSPYQSSLLRCYSYFFCSIHSLLDSNRISSLIFLIRSAFTFRLGLSAFLFQLFKIILGIRLLSLCKTLAPTS